MSGLGLSLQTVDFTQALQTVLGAQKYRERFESSPPPSLATFDFSQIMRNVLSNSPASSSARKSLRSLTAFAHLPVSLLGLTPPPSELLVYMQREGGKAPAAEGDETGRQKHTDGFGFTHKAIRGPEGDSRDSVINELPGEENELPGKEPDVMKDSEKKPQHVECHRLWDPESGEVLTLTNPTDPKTTLRGRKGRVGLNPEEKASRLVSGSYGFTNDVRLSKITSTLPEGFSGNDVLSRVATIYGFPADSILDFEAFEQKLLSGQFKAEEVAKLNRRWILEYANHAEEEYNEAEALEGVRDSVIYELAIPPEKIEEFQRGALLLGVDISALNSDEVKEFTKLLGNIEEAEALKRFDTSKKTVEQALEYFRARNLKEFKLCLKRAEALINRQKAYLDELKKSEKKTEDEQVIQNRLEDALKNSVHGQILFEVLAEAGLQIVTQESIGLLDSEVFKYMCTSSSYQESFKKKREDAINAVVSSLPTLQKQNGVIAQLGQIDKECKERLLEIQENFKASKFQLIKNVNEDFDERVKTGELKLGDGETLESLKVNQLRVVLEPVNRQQKSQEELCKVSIRIERYDRALEALKTASLSAQESKS